MDTNNRTPLASTDPVLMQEKQENDARYSKVDVRVPLDVHMHKRGWVMWDMIVGPLAGKCV